MPDIPKVPVTQLNSTLRALLKTSRDVRAGIATHAEKHAAARRAQHAELENNRKLLENSKP